MSHTSVLLNESIAALQLTKGMTILDATFGAGGHSRAIAEIIGKEGHLISFDADHTVFTPSKTQELERLTHFTPVVENFRNIAEVFKRLGDISLNGALFDLGLSSTQLERSGRGFSFQRDEPLQMTFAHNLNEGDVTAATILNEWSAETLATIFEGFGEERFARSIAKGITEARKVRPFTRTGQLVEVIHNHTPHRYHYGRTHFATRTFQALRMAANDELGAIEHGISSVLPLMKQGGRIAVISFHSIEDRAVKRLFQSFVDDGRAVRISKKPIIATEEELMANPRARSAKLRIIEKI